MDLRPVRRSATQTMRQTSPAIHGLTARVGARSSQGAGDGRHDLLVGAVLRTQDKARVAHLAVPAGRTPQPHRQPPRSRHCPRRVPRQTAVQHPKQGGRTAAEIARPQNDGGVDHHQAARQAFHGASERLHLGAVLGARVCRRAGLFLKQGGLVGGLAGLFAQGRHAAHVNEARGLPQWSMALTRLAVPSALMWRKASRSAE